MTTLVDWQIEELCLDGLVSPFNRELINPVSLDLRIGDTLLIENRQRNSGFVPYENFKYCTKDAPYYLIPNEFVLVGTLESLNMPHDHMANVCLKSSRAREGLNHSLAGLVDNEFHGVLTLELSNITQYKYIPLYPGLRVVQLEIKKTSIPKNTYKNGRYSGKSGVSPSLDN